MAKKPFWWIILAVMVLNALIQPQEYFKYCRCVQNSRLVSIWSLRSLQSLRSLWPQQKKKAWFSDPYRFPRWPVSIWSLRSQTKVWDALHQVTTVSFSKVVLVSDRDHQGSMVVILSMNSFLVLEIPSTSISRKSYFSYQVIDNWLITF